MMRFGFHDGLRRAARRGFTIVELMFVVIIITVLATIAVPSFTETQRTDKLVQVADQVKHAFELARTRALLKGTAVRIIVRPNVPGGDSTPNIRVDESWNTSCNGWATSTDPDEVNVNADCTAWTDRTRCGVVTVNVTNANTLWFIRDSGILFESVTVGGAAAGDPLVLCMNRRGRLLRARDASGTAWVSAGAPGQGVRISLTRNNAGVMLGRKIVFVGQGGVPGVVQ